MGNIVKREPQNQIPDEIQEQIRKWLDEESGKHIAIDRNYKGYAALKTVQEKKTTTHQTLRIDTNKIPNDALHFVILHELGHSHQSHQSELTFVALKTCGVLFFPYQSLGRFGAWMKAKEYRYPPFWRTMVERRIAFPLLVFGWSIIAMNWGRELDADAFASKRVTKEEREAAAKFLEGGSMYWGSLTHPPGMYRAWKIRNFSK
jgi:hypothetical protein